MRLAVLADIHGNLPALDAVLDDIRPHAPDGIVVAGDLVTRCPFSNETVAQLRTLGGWLIRGNGDADMLRYRSGDAPAAWLHGPQYATGRWVYRHLSAATLDFLAALPEQQAVALPGVDTIRIVHGSPWHIAQGIAPENDPATLARALAETAEPVLVCAHTHLQWQWEQGGRLALNPGSVAEPLDERGGGRAQYALLTWQGNRWRVELREVRYDFARLRAAFHDSGLLEEGGSFARALLLNLATARNVVLQFFAHLHRVAAEAGVAADADIPDDIWQQADLTFPWHEAQ